MRSFIILSSFFVNASASGVTQESGMGLGESSTFTVNGESGL